ncbi:MAG: hypothetical protein ACHRHE_21455 [Tepidisphaerales bacterium]
MKYFTAELWGGYQPGRPGAKQAYRDWDAAMVAYRGQLARLMPRLTKTTAEFFTKHSLHDGTLVRACFGDAVDATRPGVKIHANRRTALRLTVVVTWQEPFLYRLSYSGIAAFEVRSDESLFPAPRSLFGDWGYDELLPEGKEHLRHNVLFQTGTEISIAFRRFSFVRHRLGR